MVGESAGELTVEYVVVSDSAMRKLAQIQKQFDKVGDSAEKQGKQTIEAFKKQTKAMAMYGAAATGMLYGLIKASSYSAMWMDQLNHSMTRVANVIMEKLGLKDAVDFLVESLGNLASELENPEKTTFWDDVISDFKELDTVSKIATISIGILGAAITLISLAVSLIGFDSLLASLGIIATKGVLVAKVMGFLKLAFAAIAGALSSPLVIIGLLIVALGYLWSKTEHGQKQIQALINVWNNFRDNWSQFGFLSAFGTAIGELVTVIFVELKHLAAEFWRLQTLGWEFGKGIIKKIIEGIDLMIPGFSEKVYAIYNKFLEVFNYIKTLAWEKGIEIINRVIDGINAKLPGFKAAIDKLTNIFSGGGEEIAVEANWVGHSINDGITSGVNAAVANTATGLVQISDSFSSMSEISGSYWNSMIDDLNSYKAAQATKASTTYSSSSKYAGWDDFGHTGSSAAAQGYSSSIKKSSMPGGGDYSATGGHVLRTGAQMVHQGEDIVNLKSLLSGIKSGGGSGGSNITINPVINISSNGRMSDTFETNKIANVISKRMGDELRRISANI